MGTLNQSGAAACRRIDVDNSVLAFADLLRRRPLIDVPKTKLESTKGNATADDMRGSLGFRHSIPTCQTALVEIDPDNQVIQITTLGLSARSSRSSKAEEQTRL